LLAALPYAWPLPRWEADDFAAAFVCANKLPPWLHEPLTDGLNKLHKGPTPNSFMGKTAKRTPDYKFTVSADVTSYYRGNAAIRGGGVRLIPQGLQPHGFASDAQYRYHVTAATDKSGFPNVTAFTTNYFARKDTETFLFRCRLDKMPAFAKRWEKAQKINSLSTMPVDCTCLRPATLAR
jgi:hypothetical protein